LASSAAAAILVAIIGTSITARTVAYFRDPERQRERIEQLLVEGNEVALLEETGLPRWSRWIAGNGKGRISNPTNGILTIELLDEYERGLLELVGDTKQQCYGFRAEVRQNRTSTETGHAGIYLLHSQLNDGNDGLEHCFCDLEFNDIIDETHRGEIVRPGNLQMLAVRRYRDPVLPMMHDCHLPVLQNYFRPAVLDSSTDPWRKLAIVVTPCDVHVLSWDVNTKAKVRTVSRLQLQATSKKLMHNSQKINHPNFAPNESLGLYISRGSASFRQVIIKPLNEENLNSFFEE
jgi:hypothetical protein